MGHAGVASVRPTSTTFADAGAAAATTATSAATTMNGRWTIARIEHDRVPGDAVPRLNPLELWTLIAFGPLSPFSSSKETLAPSLSERYPSPVIPEK